MPPTIRLATEHDAEQIQAIYAPIVRDTVISFEVDPPSVSQMRQRVVATLANYPWLVCDDGGQVLGYVYGSNHRTRAAYQWSVDVSAYVHAAARRRGIGRALYTALFELLRLQGFYNAYAGITLPNPASVALHESVGFEPLGVYQAVGFKLGGWHDVGWWQRPLRAQDRAPEPPRNFPALRASIDWDSALAPGRELLDRRASGT
jgi:phosphinothricin acetyltransferase